MGDGYTAPPITSHCIEKQNSALLAGYGGRYTSECIMVVAGDCREVMAGMEPESVDAIVTDPPYGLEFMGKEWDRLDLWHTDETRTRTVNRQSTNPLDGKPRYGCEPQKMQIWHKAWAREAYRVLKPGGHLLAFGGSRTYHRMACAVEDAGFEIRDQIMWLYGSGFPKSHNLNGNHKGWGTALKPAHEPIVVARKPLIGTVAANVERYGTGALNIDASRVGTDTSRGERYNNRAPGGGNGRIFRGPTQAESWQTPSGRWPANVVLDEEAGRMLDEQSGNRPGMASQVDTKHTPSRYFGLDKQPGTRFGRGDNGGASRFFYCAKASRKERERGLNGGRCVHPTVKPVALMRWLVRLVTPPGGLVLDPFVGSGTTGVACVMEGFRFMGIEQDSEYAEIAERRIAAACPSLFGAVE